MTSFRDIMVLSPHTTQTQVKSSKIVYTPILKLRKENSQDNPDTLDNSQDSLDYLDNPNNQDKSQVNPGLMKKLNPRTKL